MNYDKIVFFAGGLGACSLVRVLSGYGASLILLTSLILILLFLFLVARYDNVLSLRINEIIFHCIAYPARLSPMFVKQEVIPHMTMPMDGTEPQSNSNHGDAYADDSVEEAHNRGRFFWRDATERLTNLTQDLSMGKLRVVISRQIFDVLFAVALHQEGFLHCRWIISLFLSNIAHWGLDTTLRCPGEGDHGLAGDSNDAIPSESRTPLSFGHKLQRLLLCFILTWSALSVVECDLHLFLLTFAYRLFARKTLLVALLNNVGQPLQPWLSENLEGQGEDLLECTLHLWESVFVVLVFCCWCPSWSFRDVSTTTVGSLCLTLPHVLWHSWPRMADHKKQLSRFQAASTQRLRNRDDVCAICLGRMRVARVTRCDHFFSWKLPRKLAEV